MSKDRLVHFRLNEELYGLLSKEVKERGIDISGACRTGVQLFLDFGKYIEEPDENTFVRKMYSLNVKNTKSLTVKRMGDIRKAFISLWNDGIRCVTEIDISSI